MTYDPTQDPRYLGGADTIGLDWLNTSDDDDTHDLAVRAERAQRMLNAFESDGWTLVQERLQDEVELAERRVLNGCKEDEYRDALALRRAFRTLVELPETVATQLQVINEHLQEATGGSR